MKKLLIMLSIMILVGLENAKAESSADIINNSRHSIGAEFNATVKAIKTYLKSSDSSIKIDKDSIDTSKIKIDNLKNSSLEDENNPTVLDHGGANLPSCVSATSGYSNEATCRSVHDLVWARNKWTWKKPTPKADCNPSSGEVKVADGNDGFICKQNGTYTSTTDGYGPCLEPIGLKYSQGVCIFKNSSTGKSYQVDASNCGTAAAQTSKVCGYDWKIISYNACRSGDVQDANYQCQERATGKSASNSKCLTSRPSSTKSCIFYTYSWATSAYGSCQSNSKQYRTSICKQSPGNATVADAKCGTKPSLNRACTYYTGSWRLGSYSSCSVSGACGQTGVRTATYSCQGGPCASSRPSNSTISCSTAACPVGSWVRGSYSSCSVSACGQTGTRTATYSCVGGVCSGSKPSNSVISCSTAACPPTGTWVRSGYSSCSVSGACGQTGTRTATYSCVGGVCSGSKPSNSVISCSTAVCPPGRWVMGSYSACSAGNGCGQTGTRTATYSCVGGICSTAKPRNSVISCSSAKCYWVTVGSYSTPQFRQNCPGAMFQNAESAGYRNHGRPPSGECSSKGSRSNGQKSMFYGGGYCKGVYESVECK